ncbi:MAG: hypothetical protein CMK59_00845 [Proteobacteria bacterium]|nr:hypothetical protein [Pseudomonadota bacterium]
MIWLSLACSSSNDLISVSPSEITWGEINFAEAKPEEGYNPTMLSILNESTQDVSLSVINFDWEHLCLQGYSQSSLIELPTLSENSSFVLQPSVCNYLPENGERDTEVSGSIELSVNAKRQSFILEIPWQFVPVLDFQDSG